jgi:hypothetical protein
MPALMSLSPSAFPITPLAIVPTVAAAAPVEDIVAAAGIIIIAIPAISGAVIAGAPIIIIIAAIIAAAIITRTHTHAAIIAIVIGAAAQGDRTGKANRSQKLLSGPRHRLSPFLQYWQDNVSRLNWL